MDFDFGKNIVLENDRVRLQPLGQDSREGLLKIALDNPSLLQYSPKTINTEAEFDSYFDNALSARTENARYAFSIYDKARNSFAGSTSFGAVSNANKRIEIGWTWLGVNFQRSGLNRNCKSLLLEYVFEKLQFERLELKTDALNNQSRTAIEGIGGKYEGTLRSHTVMSDGRRRDTVYYSILMAEWSDIKLALNKKLSQG